jgi:hypothetical protein
MPTARSAGRVRAPIAIKKTRGTESRPRMQADRRDSTHVRSRQRRTSIALSSLDQAGTPYIEGR